MLNQFSSQPFKPKLKRTLIERNFLSNRRESPYEMQ